MCCPSSVIIGTNCVLPSPAPCFVPFFFPLPFFCWNHGTPSGDHLGTFGRTGRGFFLVDIRLADVRHRRMGGIWTEIGAAPTENGERRCEGRNHDRLAVASAVGEEEPAAPAEEINPIHVYAVLVEADGVYSGLRCGAGSGVGERTGTCILGWSLSSAMYRRYGTSVLLHAVR